MVGATYIAYQGETLAYEGGNPNGIVGALLGFLIGAVNGYLLFGTIWWLMNFYNYPFNLVATPLPAGAQQIVTLVAYAVGSTFLTRVTFDVTYFMLMAAAAWQFIEHEHILTLQHMAQNAASEPETEAEMAEAVIA